MNTVSNSLSKIKRSHGQLRWRWGVGGQPCHLRLQG